MPAAGSGSAAILTMSDPFGSAHPTWTLPVPGRAGPGAGSAGQGSAPAEPAQGATDADLAITAIYGTEYRSLVRMSALLHQEAMLNK